MKIMVLFLASLFCIGPAVGMISTSQRYDWCFLQLPEGKEAIEKVFSWAIEHEKELELWHCTADYKGRCACRTLDTHSNKAYVAFLQSVIEGAPLFEAFWCEFWLFGITRPINTFMAASYLRDLLKRISYEAKKQGPESVLAKSFIEIEKSFLILNTVACAYELIY